MYISLLPMKKNRTVAWRCRKKTCTSLFATSYNPIFGGKKNITPTKRFDEQARIKNRCKKKKNQESEKSPRYHDYDRNDYKWFQTGPVTIT